MIFPTLRLLILSIGLFLLSFILSFLGVSSWIFVFSQVGLILAALAEGIFIKTLGRFSLSVQSASHYIGQPSRTYGELEGPVHPWLKLVLRFDYPGWCEVENQTISLGAAEARQSFTYPFTPLKRGEFPQSKVPYRITGLLGLVMIQGEFENDAKQTCIPNTKEVTDYLKLRKIQAKDSWGYLPYSMAHQSGELDSLREYNPDDDASRIEWKASTRIQKPVVKVYRPEASGWITIILDCGRWMTTQSGKLTAFDRAVNSLIVLSQIIFHGGDSIRLVGISDKVLFDRAFGPRPNERKALVHLLGSLQPDLRETNPLMGFQAASRSPQRNSVVLFLSQILDDAPMEQWRKGIQSLQNKSPVLIALLRDAHLNEALEDPEAKDYEEQMRQIVAMDLDRLRKRALKKMSHMGATVVDIEANSLTAPLVNQFLTLRQRR
jgi:uncharacterized protein (DUF58 family)